MTKGSLVLADAIGGVPELLEAQHSKRRWDDGEVLNHDIYGSVADVLNQVFLPIILTPARKRGIQHSLESHVGYRADLVCPWWTELSEGPQDFLAFVNAPVVTDGDRDYR
jgi:hypothetical protein